MKPLALDRWSVQDRLTSETGAPLVPLPWWKPVRAAIDDPTNVLVVNLLPRQGGKTSFLLSLAAATLLTKRDSYIVFVAPSIEQANAIIKRKLRRPLLRFARTLDLEAAIKFTSSGVECPLTGSTLEVVPATEFTSPGRSVDLLLIDEGKGLPDVVFEAIAPSIIGAAGQIIVCSTAGRPAGWLYELVQHPGEGVWIHRERENRNPFASSRVLQTLERLFGWWNPAARERELHSEFTGDGEEFLSPGLISAAIDETLGEIARSDDEAYAFYDLSRKRDLTSRVVVLRRASRLPERTDHLVVASIRIWDPRSDPSGETPFPEVRADLGALPGRFPNLRKVLYDEGAEAGSLGPFARAHPVLSVLTEGFTPSPKSNMLLWGALAGRLHDQTLSIPAHQRLLAELRSLKTELFRQEMGWRVVDSAKRLHRDVSLALAGACYAAGERQEIGLWFMRSDRPTMHAPEPFATPTPGLSIERMLHEEAVSAELARQRGEDEQAVQAAFAAKRQAEQLAAAAAREENSKRLRAEEAAAEARERALEDADRRRMLRSDGPWWSVWH